MTTETEVKRLIAAADAATARWTAEQREEAARLIAKYEARRHPIRNPNVWRSALIDLIKMVCTATAVLVFVSLVMWVLQ